MYVGSSMQLRRASNKYRKLACTRTACVVKTLMILLFIALLFVSLFNIGLAYFLSDSDSYPYPFPMHWRLFSIETFLGYIINITHCCWGIGTAVLYYASLGVSAFVCVIFWIIWKFDTAIDLIEDMELITDETSFDEWVKLVAALFADIRR